VNGKLRLPAFLLATLILAGALATAALAVAPKSGKRYSGSGTDYWNNGRHLKAPRGKGKRQRVSFRVSRDGLKINKFSGGYSFYCGNSHGTITASALNVTSRGTFGGSGTRPATNGGKRTGTEYLAISGKFIDGGRKAKVSYLFNFVPKGHKAPNHPFELRYRSPNQTCESLVRATVKVR
jgi:hypothetical protein